MPWLGIEPAPYHLPIRRSTTRATKASKFSLLIDSIMLFETYLKNM